jgi:hypothetical protein
MPELSQPNYIGDWLKFEERNLYCRQAVTILSGQKLVSGAVLGQQASGGKYVAFDGAGTDDGRRTAAGILVYDVDASATGANADTPGVIIARGPATINPLQLTWLAAQTSYMAAALASLLALGIVAGTGE